MDIVCLVIDHLVEDKHSLGSYSLVCSAWLHISQTNLFRTITIQSPIDEDRFSGFLVFLQGHPDGEVDRGRTWRAAYASSRYADPLGLLKLSFP
ncbi:hypothetical protein C8T65DRAFT_187364 [Cerioporus squamosus]|nr:hypothetical protein C8T65DRAFT_187364 [Cerioporus squamosus]